MSLKDKAEGMNSGKGIQFMEGRTKGETDELLDKTVTIRDYAFINGTDGEYVVFIVDKVNDKFYFGGKVLTDNLKQLTDEEHVELMSEGLPTKFTLRVSKNKKKYVAVEFYPED